MDSVKIPASVRVTGEASSLAVEWSHDVCRFLLRWFKLNPVKSSKEAAKDVHTIENSIGMLLIEKMILQVSPLCTCWVGPCIDFCLCI